MRTYTPSYVKPTVDIQRDSFGAAGGPTFTLYSPDPYNLPVYSLPIPFNQAEQYAVAATYSADTAVTAGFKLLAWYGTSAAGTLPGATGFFASTLVTRDLATTPATFTGTIINAGTDTWVRIVFEIDTCTANIREVTTTVSKVSLFDKGKRP